jgi:hypothetical protein
VKLLDVVEWSAMPGQRATIVELDDNEMALIEYANENGVTQALIPVWTKELAAA